MERIAEFEKVDYENFLHDVKSLRGYTYCGDVNTDACEKLWNSISIPQRPSKSNAGYDILATCNILLKPGKSLIMPTGLRVQIDSGWFLMVVPKSEIGQKYRVQLDNTIGIIDGSFYDDVDTKGHIFIKITNDTKEDKNLMVKKGSPICQGIFIPYGVTKSDTFDVED